MRKETVLFFQELYQNSISQDKILDFCKIVQKMELEKEQSFFVKNIYLSERAQRIEKQFRVLEEQVEEAEMPADFLEIQKKLQILKETTQRYLLYSMKNLDQNVCSCRKSGCHFCIIKFSLLTCSILEEFLRRCFIF